MEGATFWYGPIGAVIDVVRYWFAETFYLQQSAPPTQNLQVTINVDPAAVTPEPPTTGSLDRSTSSSDSAADFSACAQLIGHTASTTLSSNPLRGVGGQRRFGNFSHRSIRSFAAQLSLGIRYY
ncbi:hypothetical protein [Rhodococcus globerulus]|uniref:hypothetical protein n=1 Tax=Rhodococcus globerulus TaxID=33008 RepID=UPI0030178288